MASLYYGCRVANRARLDKSLHIIASDAVILFLDMVNRRSNAKMTCSARVFRLDGGKDLTAADNDEIAFADTKGLVRRRFWGHVLNNVGLATGRTDHFKVMATNFILEELACLGMPNSWKRTVIGTALRRTHGNQFEQMLILFIGKMQASTAGKEIRAVASECSKIISVCVNDRGR